MAPEGAARPELACKGACSGYARVPILHEINVDVAEGQILGVTGANGAGKTTLLRTLAGVLPLWSGTIHLAGAVMNNRAAHQRVADGLVLIPEGRQVFRGLDVEGNLDVTLMARGRLRRDTVHASRMDRVYGLFPRLRDRRRQMAGTLSGGEQQMLAIARGLMLDPRVLLLDEPTQGLAPSIVDEVVITLRSLKGTMTMVLVEQRSDVLAALADDVAELSLGRRVDR